MVPLTRFIVLLLISSSFAGKNDLQNKRSEDEAFWRRQLLEMGSGGSMTMLPMPSRSLQTNENDLDTTRSEDEAFWRRQLLEMGSGGSMTMLPIPSRSLQTKENDLDTTRSEDEAFWRRKLDELGSGGAMTTVPTPSRSLHTEKNNLDTIRHEDEAFWRQQLQELGSRGSMTMVPTPSRSLLAEENDLDTIRFEDEALWRRQTLELGSEGSLTTTLTRSRPLRMLAPAKGASPSLPAEPQTVPQVQFIASISVSGEFVEFNDWLYFAGSDWKSGFELWRTNGIDTTLMKDINPGDGSSMPTEFIPFKGYLYFSAYQESTGRELWRTNGIDTTLVKDFVPGGDGKDTPGSGSSDPGGFIEFNGWLYFKVFTTEPGGRFRLTTDELWRTNGIDMEQVMVVESSYVLYYRSYEMAVFNGYLYFSAVEDSTGRELWRTNGIDAPKLFADINPGEGSSEPPLFRGLKWEFTIFDGYLYFAANDEAMGTELRRTDGFEIELVGDINQNLWLEGDPSSGTQSSLPQFLRVFDGNLYFKATDDINGYQLWRTDGVVTTRMTDFPGMTEYSLYGLTVVSDSLYFTADDGITGREVWRTDGFDTKLVGDIYPGGGWSRPTGYYEFDGFVYFQADDGLTGAELCRTDGINEVLVADLNPGGEGSYPWDFVAHGDFLYFATNNGLWRLSA